MPVGVKMEKEMFNKEQKTIMEKKININSRPNKEEKTQEIWPECIDVKRD